MKYSKNDKVEASKKLGADFKAADVFFTSFQGLKFENLNVLRDKLRASRSKFTVTRNTIISHAIGNAGFKSSDAGAHKGPTAVVTIGDPDELTRVAKILADFAKDNPALKVKGGFTSDKWLTPEDCKRLSAIGSKPELISQLANVLYSNLAQIRFVLEAPARDLAYVVEALRDKKSKE
ncbi:MAG: large subunit ribosomal protein L10 [Elusimicrobia bacterium]|nr:MAG: large subunit ribosomal protein L10 [Elusimicrobiota bacterium]KAF0157482.1 MAG: large subunit ribosomal protein L10 [Elusimicrobiota bacterium]